MHAVGRSPGSALAAALVVFAPGLHAQPAEEVGLAPVTVQSLHYGDALFHFYQDDWFDAIVRTEAYAAQGMMGPHATDAELLLGGMYLSFGQHARAADVFRRLLARESVPQPVRERAWFYLGKSQYARGYFKESGDALRRAAGQLPAAMEAERRVLLAQGLMELGRFDEAARELENWSGPSDWQAFGRYNLGVALIRAGRVEQGIALLDQVGTAEVQTEELKALRDKANLAMGYANLQAGKPAAAGVAFQRVRLNGPQSNKALLGAGWAAADEERFEAALVPWTALRERDLLDAAVQESYLAVPYAYSRLTAGKQAAVSYEAAIAAFDGELRRLGESIEAIRSGKLLEALLESEEDDGTGTFTDLKTLPDTPETRYLYHLLAEHRFQEALKDYRAMGFMRKNLDARLADLDAFAGLVEMRRAAFSTAVPAVSSRLEAADIARLERRRDELRAWLLRAQETGDWALLAEGDEQRLLAMMAGVEAELAARAGDPALANEREKARLERGVLQWRLDTAARERAWQTDRDLRRLDSQLATANRQMRSARAALITAPVSNEQFGRRIAGEKPRIEQLAGRLDAARTRQGEYLASLSVAVLEVQRERLAEYAAQARYGLATLIDRAGPRAAPTAEGPTP